MGAPRGSGGLAVRGRDVLRGPGDVPFEVVLGVAGLGAAGADGPAPAFGPAVKPVAAFGRGFDLVMGVELVGEVLAGGVHGCGLTIGVADLLQAVAAGALPGPRAVGVAVPVDPHDELVV